MEKFTASEVRNEASNHWRLSDGPQQTLAGKMLHAYADLLAEREETLSVPMNLRVALDFADNPRPYHSLACPADTNGELYRALKVLAAAYRAAHSAQAQPPAASVTDAMVNAAMRADFCGHNVADALMCGTDWNTEVMRAALEAALAAQENPNG